ncbi:histidine phosphatase family protein [Nonomuraea sp. NPDC049695]|uniref:histidine phosphatase family protein n=1 Tax=Nonomuraea sp. NPDC049695 TaxID=3154734 RepID=UPI003433BD77
MAQGINLAEVYLARHGQTTWNVQGRRQGHLDSPLTADGVLQAVHHADVVAALPVDRVFSSPLGRALSTAEILAARLALPVEIIDDLQEIHHGHIAGLTDEEIRRDFPEVALGRARNKYSYRFPGGESYADAEERARRALFQIDAAGARRPLIVSHEMIGRMLLRNLLDLDHQTALSCSHPHDVIYRIDVAEQRAVQLRDGKG